jgi:Zn-finger nucleic acid-binding protein
MSIEKPSRNEDEYFAHETLELLRQAHEKYASAAAEAERKTHYMKCPKDGYDLATSEYHRVQIETCPHCGGMWVDADDWAAVTHEDRPALMTRVLSEALEAFRGVEQKRGTGK